MDQSFTSEACFEHIVVFVLKSKLVSKSDQENILDFHVLFGHLNKVLNWSDKIQFMDLKSLLRITQNKNLLILQELKNISSYSSI